MDTHSNDTESSHEVTPGELLFMGIVSLIFSVLFLVSYLAGWADSSTRDLVPTFSGMLMPLGIIFLCKAYWLRKQKRI